MSVLNLVFNELCLMDCEQQTDKQTAQSQMESFIAVLLAFDGWLKDTKGRYWDDFSFQSSVSLYDRTVCIAKDYILQDAIYDINQIKRDFFLSKIAQTPTYDHSGFESFFNSESAEGLCAAYLLQGIALSFPTADRWDTNRITARLQQLDDQSQLREEEVHINHASKEAHVEELKETLQDTALPIPQTGRELTLQLKRYFPFLRWSKGCEQALSQMGGKDFDQMFERLRALNSYAEYRKKGQFSIPNKLLGRASNESSSVKNNPRLAAQRRYSDSEGNAYECFWHLKFGDSRRIHFFPLPDSKEIFVGYVETHLPLK